MGCAKCEMEEEWSPLCVVAAPKNCRSALYVAKGYGGTRNRLGLVSGGGKVHPRTLGMATTPQNGLLAVGLKAVSVLPPTRSSNRWRPRRAGVIRVRSNRPTLVPTTVHSGVHARSAPRHPPMAWPTRRVMLSFRSVFCSKTSFLPSARRTSARQGRGWRESACTDLNLWLHPHERRRGGCWCYRTSDTLMVQPSLTNMANLTNTTTTTSAVHPVPWSEQGPDSLFIRTPSALRGRHLPHNSSVWPPPPPPVGKSRKISFQH